MMNQLYSSSTVGSFVVTFMFILEIVREVAYRAHLHSPLSILQPQDFFGGNPIAIKESDSPPLSGEVIHNGLAVYFEGYFDQIVFSPRPHEYSRKWS